MNTESFYDEIFVDDIVSDKHQEAVDNVWHQNTDPTSVADAEERRDRLLKEILGIQYQLEDPTYKSGMHPTDRKRWKARASLAKRLKERERSRLKVWIQNNRCAERAMNAFDMLRLVMNEFETTSTLSKQTVAGISEFLSDYSWRVR